jgi:hypothetical protein
MVSLLEKMTFLPLEGSPVGIQYCTTVPQIFLGDLFEIKSNSCVLICVKVS